MKAQDACDLFEKTIVVCLTVTVYSAVVSGITALIVGIIRGLTS